MDPLHPWLDHYPDGVDWHAPIPAAPLHRLMQDAGARFGSRPAFDFLGRRTTWAEAAAMAARIAAGFQRLGYVKGDRVGLLLPNCPAYPLLFFGALQAGLTVVNFNPLYTVRELEAQARDAEVRAVATLDLAAIYPKAAARRGSSPRWPRRCRAAPGASRSTTSSSASRAPPTCRPTAAASRR